MDKFSFLFLNFLLQLLVEFLRNKLHILQGSHKRVDAKEQYMRRVLSDKAISFWRVPGAFWEKVCGRTMSPEQGVCVLCLSDPWV